MAEVTVLVVDDHPLFASGTVDVLAKQPGLRPIGYALGLAEAVVRVREGDPDVVVCDVMIDGRPDGLELPSRVHSPGSARPAILYLSEHVSPHFRAEAVAVGGAGYLPKTAEPDEVTAAIRSVASGATVFPRSAIAGTTGGPRRPSPREVEILVQIASGASTAEVGRRLGISSKTVETHIARLFKRYSAASRTHLVVMADRRGWLTRPPRSDL